MTDDELLTLIQGGTRPAQAPQVGLPGVAPTLSDDELRALGVLPDSPPEPPALKLGFPHPPAVTSPAQTTPESQTGPVRDVSQVATDPGATQPVVGAPPVIMKAPDTTAGGSNPSLPMGPNAPASNPTPIAGVPQRPQDVTGPPPQDTTTGASAGLSDAQTAQPAPIPADEVVQPTDSPAEKVRKLDTNLQLGEMRRERATNAGAVDERGNPLGLEGQLKADRDLRIRELAAKEDADRQLAFERAVADNASQRQKAVADLRAHVVDPRRLMNSMSAFDLAGIGSLAALNAGAGGEATASYLKNAVDADNQFQKDRYGADEKVLGYLTQEQGDLRSDDETRRAAAKLATADHLEASAATMTDATVKNQTLIAVQKVRDDVNKELLARAKEEETMRLQEAQRLKALAKVGGAGGGGGGGASGGGSPQKARTLVLSDGEKVELPADSDFNVSTGYYDDRGNPILAKPGSVLAVGDKGVKDEAFKKWATQQGALSHLHETNVELQRMLLQAKQQYSTGGEISDKLRTALDQKIDLLVAAMEAPELGTAEFGGKKPNVAELHALVENLARPRKGLTGMAMKYTGLDQEPDFSELKVQDWIEQRVEKNYVASNNRIGVNPGQVETYRHEYESERDRDVQNDPKTDLEQKEAALATDPTNKELGRAAEEARKAYDASKATRDRSKDAANDARQLIHDALRGKDDRDLHDMFDVTPDELNGQRSGEDGPAAVAAVGQAERQLIEMQHRYGSDPSDKNAVALANAFRAVLEARKTVGLPERSARPMRYR